MSAKVERCLPIVAGTLAAAKTFKTFNNQKITYTDETCFSIIFMGLLWFPKILAWIPKECFEMDPQ